MNKSQNEQILESLKAGQGLTAFEAMNQFGIMRLASRINDLRSDGHPIVSQRVDVRNRNGQLVKVAKYWLV